MNAIEIALRLQRTAAVYSSLAREMRRKDRLASLAAADDLPPGVDLVAPFERTAAAMYAAARLFYAVHACRADGVLDQVVAHLQANPSVDVWWIEPVAEHDRLVDRVAELEDDRDVDADLAAAVGGSRRRRS